MMKALKYYYKMYGQAITHPHILYIPIFSLDKRKD